jgi:hypothetical protein
MATSQYSSAGADPMASGDQTDASQGAPTGGDDDGSQNGGYVIEIRVGADKSISVCVESAADEDAEESGGGDDGSGGDSDDNSTPVKSIKEALTMALEIYRNDGEMPQQADADFQQGFQGAST